MVGRSEFFLNFWEAPHRPLFSAAICCALLSIAWWPLGVRIGLPYPKFEPVVVWHIHELIFGFSSAAIGGYLLTALPAWTGKPPVRGAILKVLLTFWVSARLAMGLASHVPNAALLFLNTGYFLLLAGIVGHQLLSKGVFNKLWFLLAPIGLGFGEALFLRTTLTGSPWFSIELGHSLLIGLVLLMASVGMRAIPAFTNNWHAQNDRGNPACTGSEKNRAIVQALLAIAVILSLSGQNDLAHLTMIAAAVVLFWIMRRWQSLSALSNPLLAAQHLAFLWLPVGSTAVGIAGLFPAIYPTTGAWHAITIGGMSGLVMAISGRAAAHTPDGDMQANSGFTIGFSLVWFATWVRLAAPAFPGAPLVTLASVLWCSGWIAFAVGYLPALTSPLRRPVLSGRRHGANT
ncbi:NnrS family protein [Ruegeria lacuscaerulensis]|uniref:NnrS family protein n=1 Tax=Ruegeria lacuscaerulensis TaxID=55218 RepID=UPI001F2A067B|nr:NnrS family protein [Ruegeria lacuscaerulensis]